MTLTEEYQQSEAAAVKATELTAKNSSAEAHRDAAGKHFVAAILARNIGDEKAIQAHESKGEEHHRKFKQLEASGTSEGAVKAWETRHGGMSYGDLNKASTDASQRATDMAHDALRQKDNNGAYARTVDAHTNAARTHEQAAQAAEAAGNKDAAAYHRHMEFMHKAHANWAESMAEGKGGHSWHDMAQDSSTQANAASDHANTTKAAGDYDKASQLHRQAASLHESAAKEATDSDKIDDHKNAAVIHNRQADYMSRQRIMKEREPGSKMGEDISKRHESGTIEKTTLDKSRAAQAATAKVDKEPTTDNHAAARDAHTEAGRHGFLSFMRAGQRGDDKKTSSAFRSYHRAMADHHAAAAAGMKTDRPQMPSHVSRLLSQQDVETPAERADEKMSSRISGDSAKYAGNAKIVKALQAAATMRMSANAPLMAAMSDGKISFSDLQQRLSSLCQDIPMLNDDADGSCSPCCWAPDIILEDGNWKAIVSASDGCLYEVPFTVTDGEVDINGDPVEVEKVTDYVEVATDGYETALASASAKGSEAKFSSQAEQDANAKENLHESGGAPTVDGDETFCCPNCGHEFEDSDDVAGGDSGQVTCPSCQKPFKVESADASKRQALEAASAKAAQTRYRNAAVEASDASVAVAKAHSDAASLHNIAKEHALMCGYQPESFMHGAKAKEHLDACEACNASTVPHSMPART